MRPITLLKRSAEPKVKRSETCKSDPEISRISTGRKRIDFSVIGPLGQTKGSQIFYCQHFYRIATFLPWLFIKKRYRLC